MPHTAHTEPDALSNAHGALSDEAVVERVLAGDTALFELLMRRHNQRLYRLTVSVLRNDQDARDVMQESYLKSFEQLARFRGDAQFGTWLGRIALHAAWSLARQRSRWQSLDALDPHQDDNPLSTPDAVAGVSELRGALLRAIDRLPDPLRIVFVARDVEEMSTRECAAYLEISEHNVKVRLHRARARLRQELRHSVGPDPRTLLTFGFERCDALVERVLTRVLEDFVTRERVAPTA